MPAYLGNTDLQTHYLGSTPIDELYFGSTKVWPSGLPPSPYNIFIGGLSLTQVDLESRITGETFVGWLTGSNFTQYTSSTQYTMDTGAFIGPKGTITSFIDSGGCTSLGINTFTDQNSLTII